MILEGVAVISSLGKHININIFFYKYMESSLNVKNNTFPSSDK